MANSEHLAKLKKGVGDWNEWRKTNRKMAPSFFGSDYICRSDLSTADLSTVDLSGAKLHGTDLTGVDLSGADLCGADLGGAKLTGAKLYSAGISDGDLSGADLYRADLSDADLTGADLTGNLSEADLSRASLREANLHSANLRRAHLRGADLSDADLRGADLGGADLSNADLRRADMTKATIDTTTFGNNDLSDVKGLETVRHNGPSTIGLDTIYRSQGKIPVPFLRGAGVPDNFIEYMGSLTGKALEFYSCFISYSTKDQEFADRLYADLQNKGVRCWFAPHDIQAGKKIHEQIDVAIRSYERLLLILSPNSMKSKWVETEIIKARKREIAKKRKKRAVFPVRLVPFEILRDWECLDSDTGEDLAREIRKYYIPDFSDWKNHDSYTKEFQNLLRDLKAEGSKAA